MNKQPQPNLRTRRLKALKNQVARLERRLSQLNRRSMRYAQMRLVIFLAGLLVSGVAFYLGGGGLGAISLVISIVVFGGAVYYHQRLEQSIIKHQIWLQLKSAQIARMELDWEAIPPAVMGRARADHAFARDLDLTGDRSLHRLIDTCVSREGSQRLREWFFETEPDLETILRRQMLVKTVVPLSRFRDKLSLYGLLAATGSGGWWQGERLLQWLAEDDGGASLRPVLLASALLAPFNIILFTLYALEQLPPYWIFPFALYAGLAFLKWRETTALFHNTLTLQNGLKKLEGVFQFLETFPLARYKPLQELCRLFLDPDHRPSAKIKQVSRLAIAAGLPQNPAIGLLLNLLAPWNLYFAHRLHGTKADIAQHLPAWLAVWFELEAINSLAEFAYLNPDYKFPEITRKVTRTGDKGQVLFQAQNLGHPLIPHAEKVCNDFTLAGPGELSIITGSNMAGKSSFLRTVGVNLRLAYVGGPVNATACQTALFRLFSCLNVSDSVTDGISYFYAEVKRLKALLSELERDDPLPLCYLIDEIFRGTNNRERYLGSRAYIRTLVGQNGVGLIATHDLELVKLADEFVEIKNYHFREEVVEGRMAFDYHLHAGPCPTTNALKIMKLAGLPIET